MNMTMYNSSGIATTNATEATRYVYHIIVLKLIPAESVSNIIVVPSNGASVTVEMPSTVQLSD